MLNGSSLAYLNPKGKMMKNVIVALFLFANFATSAFAADQAFYIGANIGSAKKAVPDASETNTAFGVFGGYSFNEYIAAEVGYIDLGKAANDLINFNTFDVTLVGSYPINPQFSLFGKLGMASTKEEAFGLSETRSAVTYGLGGQFNLDRSVAFRLGYDRYSFGNDTIFAKGDADLYSVSALFKF